MAFANQAPVRAAKAIADAERKAKREMQMAEWKRQREERAARPKQQGWPRGTKFSAEHRAKISAAQTARFSDPIAREVVALAQKKRWSKPQETIGECVYCGEPATTMDHVIPRGRPGWDDPDNVVPACQRCNTSKGALTPEEWLTVGLYASRAGQYAVSRPRVGRRPFVARVFAEPCVYCDGVANTLDHVVPGQPEVVPACQPCNASKNRRTPEQWLSAGLRAS